VVVFRCSLLTLLSASLLLFGCDEPEELMTRVEVGVFFGGQVQRLSRIEIDVAHPKTVGFRVHLAHGRQAKTLISYEIVAPGPAGRRVTRTDSFSVEPGRDQIDQVIPLGQDPKWGVWNVRVTSDQGILADRALFLVEPGAS